MMTRGGCISICAIAALSVASTAHAQGLFPPLPVPLPLPPPTSNYGESAPPAIAPADTPATTLTPGPAPAIEVRSEADREALRESRQHALWVGWQSAPGDIASVAIVLIGAEYHDVGTGLLVATPVYSLTSPVIHVARGEVGKGLVSLAMRLLLPALGFAMGASLGATPLSWPAGRVTVDEGVGLGVGAAAASAFDAAVLGWERWEGQQTAGSACGFVF